MKCILWNMLFLISSLVAIFLILGVVYLVASLIMGGVEWNKKRIRGKKCRERLMGIKSENPEQYGPPPLSSREAMNILSDYFLGENFYIPTCMCGEQANSIIVSKILDNY